MGKYTKLLAVWGPVLLPMVALIVYVGFIRPGGTAGIPNWARWVIVSYFILAPWALGALWGRRPGGIAVDSKYALFLRSHSRSVWKIMFYIYVYSFFAGSVMVVVLRNTFPLRYLILPLIFNLIFILFFCWILFWRGSSKSPK